MINYRHFYDFMDSHPLMVIASRGPEGQPQSAVVGFGQTDDLHIVFRTQLTTRKAKNIARDPRVSIVIGWDKNGTLQYEGKARLLTSEEAVTYAELYSKKDPREDPEKRYFLVKPSWIRYTDISTHPWTVQETDF